MPLPDKRLEEFNADNLSTACIFSDAEKLTFNADHPYCFVMPQITDEILEQYYPSYHDDMPEDLDVYCAIALEEYVEFISDSFIQSDSFFDWEQDFEPMTHWFYPVPLRDKSASELETIATNISKWSGNVTLLECNGEYYLTLNACGSNFSWDLAAAFIACGLVPPLPVLTNLPAMAGGDKYKSTLDNTVSSLVLSSVLKCAIVLAHRRDSLTNSLETLTN